MVINSEENGIFEIYDVQGKKIFGQVFRKGIAKLDISLGENASGLYLCRAVYENGKIESGKLILQKE